MNYGSTYNHRVTLRLNDEQYDFLIKVSELLGVSPSDYVRMSINTGMIGMTGQIDKIKSGKFAEEELKKGIKVGTDANVETNINNLV